MLRRLNLTAGILVFLTATSTAGWSKEKAPPPAKEETKLGVKELLKKHQDKRPKIPILGEPLVSRDRTRVYWPYLPYNYDYGYNPWFYGAYSYSQPKQPPIVLFNDELDMALMWDDRWQHFRWEAIVPPRTRAKPLILVNQADKEESAKPAEKTLKVSKGEILFLEKKAESQKLTIRAEGKDFSYLLAKDVVALRGGQNEKAIEARIDELRLGDQVELRFQSDDKVNLIRATYKLLQGKVVAIAQGTVLLESGETFKLIPGARVLLPDKSEGKSEDLKASVPIRAQIGPISGSTSSVEIIETP